jgi:hypothetical protein
MHKSEPLASCSFSGDEIPGILVAKFLDGRKHVTRTACPRPRTHTARLRAPFHPCGVPSYLFGRYENLCAALRRHHVQHLHVLLSEAHDPVEHIICKPTSPQKAGLTRGAAARLCEHTHTHMDRRKRTWHRQMTELLVWRSPVRQAQPMSAKWREAPSSIIHSRPISGAPCGEPHPSMHPCVGM